MVNVEKVQPILFCQQIIFSSLARRIYVEIIYISFPWETPTDKNFNDI